jgi:hypothetical protein
VPWYDYLRLALFVLWGAILLPLTVKLLITRRRWRHPLRGNSPMLWALLLLLAGVEWARARNIAVGAETPPPFIPSLLLSTVATLLIIWWLWRQMELIPRWIREHIRWRRTRADYTIEEHEHHAADAH